MEEIETVLLRHQKNLLGGSLMGETYADAQLKAFKAMGIVQVIVYTLLLAMAIYNTYFFLYRQKRYRIYFITVFYVLAYLVILFRLALSI